MSDPERASFTVSKTGNAVLSLHDEETTDLGSESKRSRAFDEESKDTEAFHLPEDVYSLLFCSPFLSSGTLYGMTIFFLQIAIMYLICQDLLTDDLRRPGDEIKDVENVFLAPASVDIQVVISQFLAIAVAVVSQDDALVSIDAIFAVIYDAKVMQRIPGATMMKWKVCNLLRWIEGVFSLFIGFVIVAQSRSVLGIFLEFAALEFVSELDNVCYTLARTGYVGRNVKHHADNVRKVMAFRRSTVSWRFYLAQMVFVLNLAAMFICLGVVHKRQSDGRFLQAEACNSVYVTLGDSDFSLKLSMFKAYTPEYPGLLFFNSFDGRYIAQFDGNNRPVYYQEIDSNVDASRAGKFYYCEDELSWQFTVPALQDLIPDTTKTPGCPDGWLMQSPITVSETLEGTTVENWNYFYDIGILGTLSGLHFRCGQCSRASDCNLKGHCDEETGECVCHKGRRGITCSVLDPYCEELVWVHYGDNSLHYHEEGPFTLVRNEEGGPVLAYQRPVYQSALDRDRFTYKSMCSTADIASNTSVSEWKMKLENETDSGCTQYVVYTGGCWVNNRLCGKEDARNWGLFHGYWNSSELGIAEYFSEPTAEETPSGFGWNRRPVSGAKGSFGAFLYSYSANVRFECADVGMCGVENAVCGVNGNCVQADDGSYSCSCTNRNGGYFCEQEEQSPYAEGMWSAVRLMLSQGDFLNYCHFHETFAIAMLEGQAKNTPASHFLQYYYKHMEQGIADEFFGGGDMPYTGSLYRQGSDVSQ